MKKKISAVFSVLLTICMVASCVIAVSAILLTRTQKIPSIAGYSLMRVISGSMEPEFKTNSYILTKKVDSSILEIGDVITFYSQDPSIKNIPNTHRIIDIQKTAGSVEHFITKGDANNQADFHPVLAENMIGKVVHKIKFLGWINILQDNPFLYLIIIIVPLFFIAVWQFISIIVIKNSSDKEVKEDEE